MSAKVAELTPNAIYKLPVQEFEYSQVDFNHLNSHFMKNIPKPESYPIYGCSIESEFYDASNIKKRPTFWSRNNQELEWRHDFMSTDELASLLCATHATLDRDLETLLDVWAYHLVVTQALHSIVSRPTLR